MATTSVLKVNSPNVNKKTVIYNFYRDMLGNYNDRANKMLENLPTNTYVREDQGIVKQLQSIIQTPHGNGWAPQLSPGSNFQHNSHAHEIQQSEPPRCIQNAMLTKDKKPFTYTPGGIDLSEIRSPRMAKRLEMNAQSEGAVSQIQSNLSQPVSANRLPPSAIAAMQPALPIQVLPKIPTSVPVGKKPSQSHEQLNKKSISFKNDFSSPPPPPPPPPQPQKKIDTKSSSNIVGQQSLPKIETQNSPVRKISPPFSINQFNNLNKTPTPWTSAKLQDPHKRDIITSVKTSFPEKITTEIPLKIETNIKTKTNEYIIPIKVEENGPNRYPKNNQSTEQEVSKITNRIIPIKIDHKPRTINQQLSPPKELTNRNTGPKYKPNPIAPIQSRSFRILQKLTDSYNNNDENGTRLTSHSPKFHQEFATSNKISNRGQRSNTHSPALDMYEERIRNNQQSGCGKAYQILQQAEICEKSKLSSSNIGHTNNLSKPKINGQSNINSNNFNNITVVPVTNILDTKTNFGLNNTDQNYDISNNSTIQKRVLKQYGRTKTHSRLLHLLTSDNN